MPGDVASGVRGQPGREVLPRRRHVPILVLKPHWVDAVFNKNKTWEMRSFAISHRGKVCMAASKPVGKVCAEAVIVDCLRTSLAELQGQSCIAKHGIACPGDSVEIRGYKKIFAWVLGGAVAYAQPRGYRKLGGSVSWVKRYTVLGCKKKEEGLPLRCKWLRVCVQQAEGHGEAQS